MDVEWEESSYVANSDAYPEFDYSLVQRDTHKQSHLRRATPFIKPTQARRDRERRRSRA